MTQPTDSHSGTAHHKRQAAMPFILVTVLIDMISIGLMVPVLPHIIGTFTHSNDQQTTAFLMVTAAFGLANFVGAPIIGALSDHYGRRPVLLLGFMGLALSFFVTALATALWMIVLVRLFSGAMQSNMSVANAYVADITAPDQRARRFGLLGAMFGVGFILGPVIGGLLGDTNPRLPLFVAGVLALINLLYGLLVLPESLPPERRRSFAWERANPIAALQGLSALKGAGGLVWSIGLSALAQFMLYTTWVLYTKFKFGWGPKQVGWSLLAVGVVSVISQGVLLKPLLKRFSTRNLALVGLAVAIVSDVLFGLMTKGWMMYAVISLGLLGGAAQASIQSIISNSASASNQGETMGAVSSLSSLMAVLGPIFGLELLRRVAHLPGDSVWIGLPFFVSAVLHFFAWYAAWRFFTSEGQAAHSLKPQKPPH